MGIEGLRERIAYLRGLAEGLGIDETTKDGKMTGAIIDTLDMMCQVMEGMDFIEDLTFICPNCNEPIDIDDFSFESEDRIICPKCNEPINILTQEI